MSMILKNDILNALRVIIDPDFNKDIVSLGFVKNVAIDQSHVSFEIELTTPACPIKEEFKQKAHDAVMAINGIDTVEIIMTSQKRQTPASPNAQSSLNKVRSIIAVSSCKGGVGKSTVAAQCAYALAQRGEKVGIVDVDVHGPSIPALFNLSNTTVYANQNKQLIPVVKDNLKIMSFGFLLGDAPAVIRGPIVSQYVQQILHNTDWGELDYLFIDMPPGTGDVQLTVTQSAQISGAVIITTPQTLSLIDVARGILMFEKVNVPIIGLIENMSYYHCGQCDTKHYIFGENRSRALNDRFGIDTLVQLPFLKDMARPISRTKIDEHINRAVDKIIMALGKNSMAKKEIPKISFDNQNIILSWTDGTQLSVTNRDLRLSCQCALCVNELTGEKTLKQKDVKEDIAAKEVLPLGNYAIGITWNDGHSSGIYPYKMIKTLSSMTIP